MEQNRQTSWDHSTPLNNYSSVITGDLKPVASDGNSMLLGVPVYKTGSGPFSSYYARGDASSLGEESSRDLPRIIVSGVTSSRSAGFSLPAREQTSSRSDSYQTQSISFGLYQPGFSEVLLNAANILEKRSVSGLNNSTNSEGFRSPIPELSPSGSADYMPVLQSHTNTEHSSVSEFGLTVKSEPSGLKPSSSMPCLTPENDSEPLELPSFITEGQDDCFRSRPVCSVKKDISEIGDHSEKEQDFSNWVAMNCKPFNMRLVNLNHFPVTQTLYRANYRSHSTACVRARMGSIQNTAKSLDLMRSLLQKSINKEIDAIVQKYIEEYFHPAIENIRLNNGDNAVSDEHMQTVCRQILEEAKKMYSSDTRSATPVDFADVSDAGSQAESKPSRPSQLLLPGLRKRERRLSSGSESSSHTVRAKKKARPLLQGHGGSGRSTPSRSTKPDTVRREGPLWDPDRLKPEVQFVMGSKANKALGLGATRGRLYIKHPHIFKYSGDQDDKQWLHEHHRMPATGGRTYLLIVDDIKELAQTDEYRNSGALQLEELNGFTVPDWMLEKMKFQMQSMRTDFSRPSKLIYDATALIGSQQGASPANTNTMSPERDDPDAEVDADDDKLNTSAPSPLNITGGFSQETSPTNSGDACDVVRHETVDENTTRVGSYYVDSL